MPAIFVSVRTRLVMEDQLQDFGAIGLMPPFTMLYQMSFIRGTTVGLPFDPTDVIDNLRLERYANHVGQGALSRWERVLKDAYYFFRPLMPIKLRKHVQRARLNGWRDLSFPRWPVDTTVEDLCEQVVTVVHEG